MTKHDENDTQSERDRPVEFSEVGEGHDSVVRRYRQSLERLQNTLVFEGLSLSEAYIEGRARIAVEFGPHPAPKADGSRLISVWNHNGQFAETTPSGNASGIKNVEPLDFHHCVSPDKHVMLVSNVEPVNSVKFMPVYLERLYFIEDEQDHIAPGEGSCFLSIKGGFRILPRVAKRELSPSIDAPAISLDKGAVSVIQGRAKIMDRIADDGRRMSRNPTPEGAFFPSVRVGLWPEGFDVVHRIGSDNRFELLDVMIGPFYF